MNLITRFGHDGSTFELNPRNPSQLFHFRVLRLDHYLRLDVEMDQEVNRIISLFNTILYLNNHNQLVD